ncbi:MAG: chorismate mutase [Kiloniellales bacterium]|nr:chorismate mutase [Kiloniellales bacterium]
MAGDRPSLEDLRRRIDEIDEALQDLLIQRIEVARQAGAAKQGGRARIRPGREAEVLRRLLRRHHGPLPKAVLVRLWRELFSAVIGLQGPLQVVVQAAGGNDGLCRLAAEHFGSQTPIQAVGSSAQVIKAVAQDDGTLGVLPLPEADEAQPWWPSLARQGDSVPRIIARLPFMEAPVDRFGVAGALALGLLDPADSGCDRSFFVMESGTELSRSRLRDLLASAGLVVLDLQSRSEGGARWLHLVEVEGCFGASGTEIERLRAVGEEALLQICPIGGYAAPLSLAELAPVQEAAQ